MPLGSCLARKPAAWRRRFPLACGLVASIWRQRVWQMTSRSCIWSPMWSVMAKVGHARNCRRLRRCFGTARRSTITIWRPHRRRQAKCSGFGRAISCANARGIGRFWGHVDPLPMAVLDPPYSSRIAERRLAGRRASLLRRTPPNPSLLRYALARR
ncbi:hypothetical protein ACFFX0_33295 [Citricoccus parietis]|uniref:Uncharacterized protein n=1 Tax=Citricoccus parietis TaxID=592307 RepID=A0ABV5GA00_9MICC